MNLMNCLSVQFSSWDWESLVDADIFCLLFCSRESENQNKYFLKTLNTKVMFIYKKFIVLRSV